MSFDDEPPTKKLGRAPSSREHRETFDLALRRVKERCQRVHERCMQTVEGEARSRATEDDARPRASREPSGDEHAAYLRALYARLHGHDDPRERPTSAPPDRVRVDLKRPSPSPDAQEASPAGTQPRLD